MFKEIFLQSLAPVNLYESNKLNQDTLFHTRMDDLENVPRQLWVLCDGSMQCKTYFLCNS